MLRIIKGLESNFVTVCAFILALISIFFVHPDKEYLSYINIDTILILFMTMLLVGGFKRIRFFEILAKYLVSKFKNIRSICLFIITITFLGSMVLANDMALLTFIPLTISTLQITKKEKYAAFIITMQVISANLGGMLTPFGNPQNMYLYSYFMIDPLEFMNIMYKSFIVSLILIYGTCFFLKKEKIEELNKEEIHIDKKRTILYFILFIFALVAIFRVFPLWIAALVIFVCVIISDYKALLKVDYGLLLTFIFFFIFAGNVSRIDFISSFIESIFTKNELLLSVLSCQFISNVPSSILLSKFTSSYPSLLIGVNIGGLGTLIASLASLIALKKYIKQYKSCKKYIITFEIINFSFLLILICFNLIVK